MSTLPILLIYFILFSLFVLIGFKNLILYKGFENAHSNNEMSFSNHHYDIIKLNFNIEVLNFLFLFLDFIYMYTYVTPALINLFIYSFFRVLIEVLFNNKLQFFLKFQFLVNFYYKIFSPLYFIYNCIFQFSIKFILKTNKKFITVDDRKVITDESWQESQEEMISNIFDFAEIVALEVMTHRTDITALDEDDLTLENIVSLAVDTGYSRIPIYKETLDNVTGIIYVKDLLKFLQMDPEKFNLKDIVRTPLFIPQTLSCNKIFEEFTKNKVQMAIVLDEYGGTSGIITMEDILEFIVGNIEDEYDEESKECEQISQDEYIIDGAYSIKELVKDFDLDINEQFEDYNYTVAGYILDKVKTIPNQNDFIEIKFERFSFTVLEVDSNRITKVKLLFFRRDNYENT